MASKFSVEAVFGAVDKFSPVLKKMERGLTKFVGRAKRGMNGLDGANGRVVGSLKRVAGALAVPAAAVGAGVATVVKSGAAFEQAITDVAAVSMQTRGQIAELEKQAIALGSTTKFTATEVAKGMEGLKRAGLSNNEVLEAMPGLLSASSAGSLEMADAAEIVTGTLAGFGLKADKAMNVANVLTAAGSRAKTSFSLLGESISGVSSVAKQLGVPLEDVVASLAIMQNKGIDASVSSSALSTMLTRMATPTAALTKKMDKMGVTFQDGEGKMLPFEQVLGNLSKASKASGGNMEQMAFFAELMGARGQKAGLALASAFDEVGKMNFKTFRAGLEDVDGIADDVAEKRLDTFTGDVTKLGSAVDGVKIKMFNLQSGPLRGIVQGMTDWIAKNDEMIQQDVGGKLSWIKDNIDGIILAAKGLGAFLAVFATMVISVKAASTAMSVYLGVVKAAEFAMVAWSATATVFQAAAGGSQIAIALLTASFGPMLVAIGAVALALGSLVLLYKQVTSLSSELGSGGITGTIGAMFDQGTLNPFEAMNNVENEAARKRAAEREGKPVVSSQARTGDATAAKVTASIAKTVTEKTTTQKSEVTIKVDGPGTVSVTKQPPAGGLKLKPSGAQ